MFSRKHLIIAKLLSVLLNVPIIVVNHITVSYRSISSINSYYYLLLTNLRYLFYNSSFCALYPFIYFDYDDLNIFSGSFSMLLQNLENQEEKFNHLFYF